MNSATSRKSRTLAEITRRLLIARPHTADHARRLEALPSRLHAAWQHTLIERHGPLARLAASLDHLNPLSVLARGYSIVTDTEGRIVRNTHMLEPNQRIAVCLHSGRLEARVETLRHATEPEKN